MTARRAQTSVLALAALAALAAAAPRPALAQTRADAFAGKIPPVSGQLYREVASKAIRRLNDGCLCTETTQR